MNLRARYRRLTLWNKVAFWGSVSSIVGLSAFLIPFCTSTRDAASRSVSPLQPSIEIGYKGTDIFIHNRGRNPAEELKFYPILYTFGKDRKISNRSLTRGPTFVCGELASGQNLLVPRTNYFDAVRFEGMRNSDRSAPNPIMFVVLSFRRPEDHALFHVMEPFYTMFPDQGADPVMVFPMRQTDQAASTGNFDVFRPMIEQMEAYERTAFGVK